MKDYQVKVNTEEEFDNVYNKLIELGYEDKYNLIKAKHKVKWIIVFPDKHISGNYTEPFNPNSFPVISYNKFMEQNKYPYIGKNDFYIVKFLYKDYGTCLESKGMGLSVGYTGFCYEDTFKPINYKENTEMKKGEFIIGSIHKQTGAFSAVTNPKSHTNFLSASQEAERLAKQFTEKKFVVLEVKGICSRNTVSWE